MHSLLPFVFCVIRLRSCVIYAKQLLFVVNLNIKHFIEDKSGRKGGKGCKTKLCAEMMQQQDLGREIAALKSLHPSKFDRIAEDTQMLSSDDCAIKQRPENIENESEREGGIGCVCRD